MAELAQGLLGTLGLVLGGVALIAIIGRALS